MLHLKNLKPSSLNMFGLRLRTPPPAAPQRGIVVKHTGDGVMATFSAAVDAVAAAVAIQQAVDAHNRRSDQERFEILGSYELNAAGLSRYWSKREERELS